MLPNFSERMQARAERNAKLEVKNATCKDLVLGMLHFALYILHDFLIPQ